VADGLSFENVDNWRAMSHQVVQIKDVKTNKFVAVIVDGDVKEYGSRARKKRA
jgi:hypothetical protein